LYSTCEYGPARLPAVVEEVHEEGEVLEKELALRLHQITTVRLLGLQRQALSK
jgi:hypothetical protein